MVLDGLSLPPKVGGRLDARLERYSWRFKPDHLFIKQSLSSTHFYETSSIFDAVLHSRLPPRTPGTLPT